MTSDEFNLIDEPWIPCEDAGGRQIETGLREVLLRAHELRAVIDPSPLATAALHRLLLAIVHRCFGPTDLHAWVDLYKRGRFDGAIVEAYLASWRTRFDLFDEARPFYQVRGLPFEADSPARLITERSSWGSGVHLFEHRPESQPQRLEPGRAARMLLALQSFAPGGLVRKPGEPTSASAAPLNRGAVVLVTGATLAETILLNLLVYRPEDGEPVPGSSALDKPAWEQPKPPHIETRKPFGWLDLLTWQSRRLELRRDEAGLVNGVVYCVGKDLDDTDLRDPMVAWRESQKRGFVPIEFDPDRAIWRDSHALFRAASSAATVVRPRAIEQLCSPQVARVVPRDRRYGVQILGLRGDQARILVVRSERVPVTPKLLEDPETGESVREVIAIAEKGAGIVDDAVRALARAALSPADRQPDWKDVSRLSDAIGAQREYWARLQVEFETYVDRLSEDEPGARAAFRAAVERRASEVFAQASGALGGSARILKGAALGERKLRAGLRELRGEQPKEETHP